jgi:hypothetical protein
MRRRIALAALFVVALAQPVAAAPGDPPPRILIFGDSLVVEATPYARTMAAKAGAPLEIQARGGTAICDWLATAAGTRARFRPDIVVMAFSGNALTPCMKDVRGFAPAGSALGVRYYSDLERMAALFPGPNKVVWVTPPAPKYWNPGVQAVGATYRDASRWRRDSTWVDGNAYISPGGVWSKTQPCLPEEPCEGIMVKRLPSNTVRAPDNQHFCPVGYLAGRCPVYSSGAYRYAGNLIDGALRQAAAG